MHIRKLRLFNYKNYEEGSLEFSEGINCLVGPNGSGKTNLIDAIYYLSLTKSAHSADREVPRHGEISFSLKGDWAEGEQVHTVACGYTRGQPKMFKFDGKEYEKLSDHIGRLPLVLVAPNDTDMIRGTSEIRRRFFDIMLCQADASYLSALMKYNHVLKQRNAILKEYGTSADRDLVEHYTFQLVELGEQIFTARTSLVQEFEPDFINFYTRVSEGREQASILYESHASRDLRGIFRSTMEKDMHLGRTTAGIHRDDYHFMLDDRSMKKYGSQGQQKSLVIALKLAQYNFLALRKNTKPVILLDDIFDKLDIRRIRRLLEILLDGGMGQVFITDARKERTMELTGGLEVPIKFFEVTQGNIHEIQA